MRGNESVIDNPSPNGTDSDLTATEPPTGTSRASDHTDDRLLELLERWEQHYRRGEDATPESLGADPALWAALRSLIEDQKRLYAHLDLAMRPADDGQALPSIPGHEIIVEIGRGGMGVVYKARDLELGRIVAIKTIAEGQHATVEQRERFRAEAGPSPGSGIRTSSRSMRIGEHEGRPYLSLEYAEGGSLAHRLAERPMAGREAAVLAETLARAVHAAHQAGVVHRDLKPSNVLLTAEGIPKVSDFGLAKLLDVESERTASRPGDGLAELHVTRAGRGAFQASRPHGRHLFTGGDSLPGVDRPAAVPGRVGAGDSEAGIDDRGRGAARYCGPTCRATWRRSA